MNPLKNNWKVIGAGTALAAFGIAGFGFSDTGRNVDLPDAINLSDRVPISDAAPEQATPRFEIVPAPLAEDSLASPFDSADTNAGQDGGSGQFDSPAEVDSSPGTLTPAQPGMESASASFDSPESFTAPQSAPSQSAPPVDSIDADSLDSPESFTAPQIAPAQPAGSPDSYSIDSPESVSFDSAGFSS